MNNAQRAVTVDEIQKTVAAHYNLSQEALVSASRKITFTRPRQLAMYLAKELTTRSLPDLGRRFGGRDHTTVMHAIARIGDLKAGDMVLDAAYAAIRKKLLTPPVAPILPQNLPATPIRSETLLYA